MKVTRVQTVKKNNNNVQINIESSIPHTHTHPCLCHIHMFSLFLTYYTAIDQIIKPKLATFVL